MNDHFASGVFAAGLLQACQAAVFTPSVAANLSLDPAELAGGAYGTWCLANALGWQGARKCVSPTLWPLHLLVLKEAGAAVPVQGPVPTRFQGWFGTSSYSELADLIAKEPSRILRLLHAEFRIVSSWDPELWPVGVEAQVVSVEFSGDWGVRIERLGGYGSYPQPWPESADLNPFLKINELLQRTEPVGEAS